MASPQISRRDFLALAGLTSASAGCPAMAQALKAKAVSYTHLTLPTNREV